MNQIVDRLTEEQYQIIDFLQRHRKVAISGCAGSGKTLVAIEKAIRLDREGFSVLILCHNPYLARNIRLRTEGAKIKTFSFTEFLRQAARTPGSSEAPGIAAEFAVQDPWTQYEEPQPNDIALAMEGLSKGARKYDAIIVDEGQDFRQAWWTVVEAGLIDPKNGILYIFFDSRQVISPFAIETYPVPSAPFDLSKNCRNAGKIFKLVQKLHPSMPDPTKELEKEGVVKQWVYSGEKDFLGKFKSALLDAERYSPYFKEVIVITAELNHVYRSRLNGVVFDTPQVKKLHGASTHRLAGGCPEPFTRLRWEYAQQLTASVGGRHKAGQRVQSGLDQEKEGMDTFSQPALPFSKLIYMVNGQLREAQAPL